MRLRARFLAVAVLAAVVGLAAPVAAYAETDGVLITLEDSAGGASLLSDDGSAGSAVADELEGLGLTLTDAIESADGSTIVSAEAAPGQTDAEAAAAAAQLEGVAAAQPNFVYSLLEGDALSYGSFAELLAAFNDPFTAVSSTDTETQNQFWAYQLDLVDAWADAQTDVAREQIVVAAFDTGARFDHEDLEDVLLADLAWDATNSTQLSQSVSTGDPQGHGTHVAGILAAEANNGVGLVGSSLGAKVLPVKVFALSSTSNKWRATSKTIIAAYNYLFQLIDSGKVENLRVVNMSLGGHEFDDMKDAALENAIGVARDQYGILSVAAGGNGRGTSETVDGEKVSITQADGTDLPIYPGDYEECLSVTALNADNTSRSDSEYNDAKDISAYGTSIWSTYCKSSSSYTTMSGTSMATPMVSGAAALIFSVYPNATVDQVIEALTSTATKVAAQAAGNGSAGVLDAEAALDACPPFADVSAEDWFLESVQYVEKAGLMRGYTSSNGELTGCFGPNDSITRGQVALVLYRYLGAGEICASSGKSDVAAGAYYEKAVNWAVAKGIMTGYGDSGLFGPDDPVTREQLAKVFALLCASESEIDAASYSTLYTMLDHEDALASWSAKYVAWSLNNGILTGKKSSEGYTVDGDATSTRAETATILMRAIENDLL